MTILCTIDLLTREVSLPGDQCIAAYDHNVDVVHFQAEPVDGFDFDASTIRIAAQGPNNVRHDYAVDPSTVSIEEETGYITFDWPIPAGVTEMPIGSGFKYGDRGQLIFAVCAEIISGDTVSKAWHSDDGIITVVAHLEPEAGGGEDPEEEATNAQKIAQLQTDVAVINTQVGALGNGSPTPVATVAEMTDESAVYLYTGSETGYTAGNWYYYNGTAWTSGGTYGGVPTDTTLSISGSAADAKAVGDALAEKADADDVGDLSQLETTAKDNLVSAINEENEAIVGLNERLPQLTDGYIPFSLINDTYISGSGSETYYAGWSSTDFIPINGNELLIYSPSKITYNAFYDSSKVFISGGTFTVPAGTSAILPIEGAEYIRLSGVTNVMSSVKIYGQLAKNTEAISEIKNQLSVYSDTLQNGNVMPDLAKWITGRVYNGVYSDSVTTVKCTDFIPVIGGKTYYIYGGYISQEYFGVYDQNKALLSGWSFEELSTSTDNASSAKITLNEQAKYIRINAMANKIDLFPADAYISLFPSNLPKNVDMTDYVPRLKGNGTLSDKKVLVIGDSISTDVYGRYKKWVTYLCENCFFSKGFVTNNSYHATGFVATYKESGVVKQGTFLTRLTALGDLSAYDLIVTFGGINDWIQAVPFSEFTSAVDAYFAYLIENATQARLAVLSPLHTALYGTNNAVGKTQKDYDDYIKEVAKSYAIPLLNLTDESGFCPDKSTTFMNMWTFLPEGASVHDGVHPTTEWERKHLAPQIAWFLAGLV